MKTKNAFSFRLQLVACFVGWAVVWLILVGRMVGSFIALVDVVARLAVRQRVRDQILEIIFCKVHVVLKIRKGHLCDTREGQKATRDPRAAIVQERQSSKSGNRPRAAIADKRGIK